jgi:hypothetical protein
MMTSPFTAAVVRCRRPRGCAVTQLLHADAASIEEQLARIGWSRHAEYGWICPQHSGRLTGAGQPDRPPLTSRTLTLLAAIREGHDFGMAIMRETGLSESTVYAALRRLLAAGWVVCELEPVTMAVRRQRPRRKIYRLTQVLLDELGWSRELHGD